MSQISKNTLEVIEEKNITPKSRWHFVLRNFIFWFLLVLSIILGALAVCTIVFMITDYDWDVYQYLHTSIFQHVFSALPYFWFIVLGLLIVAAYFNFRHTKKGYHQKVIIVVLLSIFTSGLIGAIMFSCGVDSEVHETFMHQLPFYGNLVHTKDSMWELPDKGLLAGQITEMKNPNEFTLQDFKGGVWQISGINAEMPPGFILCNGEKVEMIGQIQHDNVFSATTIRPWCDRCHDCDDFLK